MPSAKCIFESRPIRLGGPQKYPVVAKPWLSKPRKSEDHIYENVRGRDSYVTVVKVPHGRDPAKLKIAIENFDKILDEFGRDNKSQTRPRLQKAKTCSIIESKCILKKSLSNPAVLDKAQDSNLLDSHNSGKTRSLSNILDPNPAKKSPKKPLIKSETFTKSTSAPKPAPRSKTSQKPPKVMTSALVSAMRSKFDSSHKELDVEKMSVEASKRAFQPFGKCKEDEDSSKMVSRCMSRDDLTQGGAVGCRAVRPISRAKSHWDITDARVRPSRIPVKYPLARAPSIPAGLDLLDRKSEMTRQHDSQSNLRKVKSIASNIGGNLTTPPASKVTKKVEPCTGKSTVRNVVEKLENHSKIVETPKPPKNLVKPFESLAKSTDPKHPSTNLSKLRDFCKSVDHIPKPSETLKKLIETSVKSRENSKILDAAKPPKPLEVKQVTAKPLNKLPPKTLETPVKMKTVLPKSDKTPNIQRRDKGGALQPSVSNAEFTKAQEKFAKLTDDKNSLSKSTKSNPTKLIDIEKILPNTFGSLKHSCPPRFVDVSARNLKEELKKDFRNAQKSTKNDLEENDRDLDVELLEYEKLERELMEPAAKFRGYNSDSDDSGNLSNDLDVETPEEDSGSGASVGASKIEELEKKIVVVIKTKSEEELETLKAKVDKLELERTSLKNNNDKLEAKLSEMTADLAEEHSTCTLASERLDAESQERVRLERELEDSKGKNRLLQQASERLEMELLYAKSDLNGALQSDDEDMEDGPDGVYKKRYERVARELEFTRRRLQQQHEDDLEQLVALKKQLEKKLADAYEEVEEQRQVVGQWKRKVQKLNAENNDLRLLLEEQNSRNNLLEKKQRKFDAETQLLQDELRQEKQAKDRLSREKDIIIAEKYTIENNLADVRLELELKEEKLRSYQRELDEITYGGKTEEEVTLLRKQKMECERRIHEQEEELDELAGQIQLLEQAKLRLEMSLEQQRKEGKREAQQRDEELEEVRGNAQKKVKALEAQLENEHEERTLLLREKHELERRLNAVAEAERNERAGDEALLQRLRRDLRRTKALLRDAQTMLERQRADSPGKAILRQLRNQLEDLECARLNAVKAKQGLETDLSEVQAQLEEAQRQKSDAEDRANAANRERTELRSQLEENEEELAEVLKKYKTTVQQMSVDQLALQEQVSFVSELETERNHLKEQLAELSTRLESIENLGDPSSSLQAKRMELRCKELESKLELEQTTKARLEVQIARLKETVDKLQTEFAMSRTKEQLGQENLRKLQRSLRELRDEHSAISAREAESLQKRKDLEKRLETSESETSAAKADLKLALKRIEDLQSAIQGELEDTISDNSETEPESYSSDESIETFLANHKITTKSDKVTKKDLSPTK